MASSAAPAQLVVTIALFFGVVMENPPPDPNQVVGACYGKLGNNLPPPAEVVALYRRHNLGGMRVYSPDAATLQALRRTNIGVVLGVPGELLQGLASSNASDADDWVGRNVVAYWPEVRFRYLAVGNELIPDAAEARYVLPAMRNLHAAIAAAGLQNDIKVSTAVNAAVLGSSLPPSAGEFTPAAKAYMTPIAKFLTRTAAPLLANIYPYFAYAGNPSSATLSYALFTAPATLVADGAYAYRNLFDATVDAVYAALEKAGGPDVAIVVSESGWPSAGGAAAATVSNAQTYVQNLVRHVPQGTPRRPRRAVETYVFSMFDENLKAGPETEKHFGLFYPNKTAVYAIQFL